MLKEVTSKDLRDNVFKMIGEQWMLISAKKPDGSVNSMTASWGSMGVMWGKDVVFAFIRPQRFTKEFVDSSDQFTLSFFGEEHKKMLGYMGSVSGRDEDKILKSGLTLIDGESAPCFEQAQTTIICKKLFAQALTEDSFLYPETIDRWYPEKDYHIMYAGEIQKVLLNK